MKSELFSIFIVLVLSTYISLYFYRKSSKIKELYTEVFEGNELLEKEINGFNSEIKNLRELMKENKEFGKNLIIEGDAYIVFPYFTKSRKNDSEITLVTQVSFERIDRLGFQKKRFQKGDISAVLFLELGKFRENFFSNIYLVYEYMIENYPDFLEINIHLIIGVDYRINTFRNFALQFSKTDLVLVVDGDIVPKEDFFEVYQKFGPPKPKSVYLLFEYDLGCESETITNIDSCFPVGP